MASRIERIFDFIDNKPILRIMTLDCFGFQEDLKGTSNPVLQLANLFDISEYEIIRKFKRPGEDTDFLFNKYFQRAYKSMGGGCPMIVHSCTQYLKNENSSYN